MDGYELLHNGSLDHWTRAALGPLWFLGLCFGSSELLVFRGCFQSSLIGAWWRVKKCVAYLEPQDLLASFWNDIGIVNTCQHYVSCLSCSGEPNTCHTAKHSLRFATLISIHDLHAVKQKPEPAATRVHALFQKRTNISQFQHFSQQQVAVFHSLSILSLATSKSWEAIYFFKYFSVFYMIFIWFYMYFFHLLPTSAISNWFPGPWALL